MSPAQEEQRRGGRRALNALVYCLIVLAVFLAAIAAWMRYSHGRRPGEPSAEPGDAVERRIEAFMPNLGTPGSWMKAAGLPRGTLPQCRFVCPQCQSYCWTHPRRGCPACPFCGRVMARRGLGVSPVGGMPGGGPASPTMIQAGSTPPHGYRGVCANCHTVVGSGVSLPGPALAGGGGGGPPKAVWRGVAAPAIAPNAARPTLVKEFGIEVCPAPGAGVKVTGVMENSNAWNAGLRAGDIILGCNGAMALGVEQFQRLVSRAAPETDASVRILRNGRTRDLSIMVGEGEMEGFGPIQRP